MDWIVALIILLPGFYFASTRSAWLVDYTVFIFVLNRGLRRVVDYYINHSFNPLSPISLTPLVLTILMGGIVWADYHRSPPWMRKILMLFGVVFAFSTIIGFLNVRLAAFYALAEVAGPVALMAYAYLRRPNIEIKDRWVRSFSWGAVLVSVYGWYQYLTIPPWDAFWLIETKMVGYMGIPKPTEMTVFSTMGERGVVAGYLGYSVVPMIVQKKWRTVLGWPAVILVFSVILLTLSRGGLIIAGASTAIYLIVNRGAGLKQAIVGAFVLGFAAYFGLSLMPNSEKITTRYESLGNMQEDGSYKGRLKIMDHSVGAVLTKPQGLGLGSGGMATRINTGGLNTEAQILDGGYFDILLTYGAAGTVAMLAGLFVAWKKLRQNILGNAIGIEHAKLARALMLSLCVSCFTGNFLNNFSVFWLVLGTGLFMEEKPETQKLEIGSRRLRRIQRQRRVRFCKSLGAAVSFS